MLLLEQVSFSVEWSDASTGLQILEDPGPRGSGPYRAMIAPFGLSEFRAKCAGQADDQPKARLYTRNNDKEICKLNKRQRCCFKKDTLFRRKAKSLWRTVRCSAAMFDVRRFSGSRRQAQTSLPLSGHLAAATLSAWAASSSSGKSIQFIP